MKKVLFITFFLIITQLFGQKKEVIIQQLDNETSMQGFMHYYVDETRELPFNDIINKQFITLEKPPIDTQAIIWYSIKITPTIKSKYLIISPGFVEDTDFYVPSIDGYKEYSLGVFSKHKTIKYDSSDSAILILEASNIDFSKKFYFNKESFSISGLHSLKTDGLLLFSNNKDNWYHSNILRYSYSRNTSYQIIIASIFLAALLFLMNFLVLRDKNYLNYSAYLFFTSFIFMPTFPFLFNILNSIHPKLVAFIGSFSINMTATTYFYFVIQFIEVKSKFPKIYRLTKYTVTFSFLFALVELFQIVFFPYFIYRFEAHNYFNYIYLVISISVFIYLMIRKLTTLKRIVILGSFILIIGQLASLLLGNSYYFLLAVILEIIVFSVVVSLQNKIIALKEIYSQTALNNEKLKKQNLQELNQLKTTFITNISHEFRTPLTLISGPIQLQLAKKDLSSQSKKNLEIVQRNTNRLIILADQLLDVSKLESGNLKLRIQENSLFTFLTDIVNDFGIRANQKTINYSHETTISPQIYWYDKDIVEKIISNLLSNAIKYTYNNGKIILISSVKEEQLFFTIKNTSHGISDINLNKIFDRFFQIDSNQQGTGIGLALVKELIQLHKGTIHAKNIQNQWVQFELMLPVGKSVFQPKNIKTKRLPNVSEIEKKSLKVTTSNKPILLIVEDSIEIQDFIVQIFKLNYTIIRANNGKIGIEKATEHIPDVIISDIMMPEVDGITLCKVLVKNVLTSHIPIILLTAKTGFDNELTGIKTGAVDYITKPFNQELLQLKINNILAKRVAFQKQFETTDLIKTKELQVSSIDKQFIDKLQKVLDSELTESSFSIEKLSKSLGMSRMQLHRKLKALTGLSASEFIRSQRLKLAADLLQKSDVNISEIGYSVGFNDPAYFSKCFKVTYGCTPSAYSERIKNS